MRFRVILALSMLLALAAGPAFAAEGESEGILELPIDRVDITEHPEITVTVTVPRDLVGLDLQPADFFVSENGATRDLSVTRLPSDDLAVALVLDTSGSMRGEPLRAAKAAVRLFLDEMPPGVDVSLIAFGNTAELVTPFTKDLDAVLEAMDSLEAFGETALYNGVVLASNLFEVVQAPRRAIVVLSDGGDTVSGTTLADAVDALQVAAPHFVAVELDSPENDSVVLAQMARSVGGSVASAADPAGLGDVFRDAGSDLINQYELRFGAEGGGVTQLVVAVRRGTVGAVASGVVTLPPVPSAPAEVEALVAEGGAERIFVPNPTTFTVDLAWFARSEALIAAMITVFSALAIGFIVMLPSRTGALTLLGLITPKSGSRLPFSGLTQRVSELAEMALAEGWGDRRIRRLLDRAGSRLHVGEFVVLLVVVSLGAFGVAFFLANLLVGLLAAVLAPAIAIITIQAAGERRARQFRAQLSDSLQLIGGSIRAGFALNVAISAVAQEQPEPTKSEFNRIEVEVQLGRSIEEALRSAAVRTQSEDLPWVADAIDIHRETGGDIAAILDSIAASVREREQVRAEIKVLSAEGRISGLILILMPIVLAGVAYFAAPGYLDELFQSSEGQVMVGVAVGAMVIGIEWIRRIVRLRF